jgi:hypothetical protein
MNEPASHSATLTALLLIDRAVRNFIDKWADRIERRMTAEARRAKGYERGRPKPVWDRDKFVRGLVAASPDCPAAELADLFEQAIAHAHGNPARFRRELERLLG